jgi:hypothetical protein
MHRCRVSLNMKPRAVALFDNCLVVRVLPAKSARDGTAPVMRRGRYRHYRVAFEILFCLLGNLQKKKKTKQKPIPIYYGPYQSPKHALSCFKKTVIEIIAFNEAVLGRCLVYQVTNIQNLFVCLFS